MDVTKNRDVCVCVWGGGWVAIILICKTPFNL